MKATAPTARSPERRAKIAAAKRGKPRPAHVIEILRRVNTGRKHSAASRAKMSAARKAWAARGDLAPAPRVPWSAKEIELLLTLPAATVAKRTGRTLQAVYARRSLLKLPDGRRAAK
uniref:NUMOD3 domain-containing DNA-binding protein n=1 Tax=Anatilimnocola aggregata TaxID=2528021 RepID=UPI0011AB131E